MVTIYATRFSIKILSYAHIVYVFCVYLSTNSDYLHVVNQLIDFYKPRCSQLTARSETNTYLNTSIIQIFLVFRMINSEMLSSCVV